MPSCSNGSYRLDDDLQACSGARQMRPFWAERTSVGCRCGLITLELWRGGGGGETDWQD